MVILWYYNGIINGGRRALERSCHGIAFVFLYDIIVKCRVEILGNEEKCVFLHSKCGYKDFFIIDYRVYEVC